MGLAWVLLCIAFALHILDEATTGFLPLYNDTVRGIHARYPFVLLPTFTHRVWLGGLIGVCALLFALSGFAFRRSPAIVLVAYVYGAIMLGNGLLHIAGSIYRRRMLPGVYSAPLLVLAAVHMLYHLAARR